MGTHEELVPGELLMARLSEKTELLVIKIKRIDTYKYTNEERNNV